MGEQELVRSEERAALRTPAEWPALAWALVGLCVALVLVSFLSESGAFGYGPTQVVIGDATYLSITFGAAVLALTAALVRRDFSCWGLIALALLASAAGDLWFQFKVDAVEGPYPSLADGLYFAFYVLAILGLRNLATGARRDGFSIPALLTPLLGLVTLWAWIVFDPVLGTLEGTTAARMTTIAYPFLDLLLVCSVVIALAARGWRAGAALVLLLSGAALTGVADSVYASQVAHGFFANQTTIDTLWPAGAALMAAAAWIGPSAPARADVARGPIDLAFALGAIAVSLTVLIWDHFDRLDKVTVVLAGLTVTAAAARLAALTFEAQRARRHTLEAQRERGQIEALHTASVEAALDSIITSDHEGRVLAWNPAAHRTFGYSSEAAMGRVVSDLIVPSSQRASFEDAFQRFVHGTAPHFAERRFEMLGLRADHREIPVELAIARADTDPPTFTAFIRDLTKRKQGEAERERLAAMVRSTDDAMLSTNLDLTVIAWNPAAERMYGYAAEEIVGSNLERLVPPNRRNELRRLAEAAHSGETASAETTRLRKDGEVIDISLRVYPIRDEIGQVVGYSSVARDITDRRKRELERRLNREREAWQHQTEEALDHGGFEFHRQPVLDLRSGRISHHELLLRMRIKGELVPPGKFLPHVEGSQLMRRIDRWAIRHGIELAAEHPVAINLSAKSLSDAGIAAAVKAALDETGADACDITFEITETAAAENLEAAHALVTALRTLGCGVALDDFGTGYGSFTYLLRMPVTSLKLDMEFIQALSDDPADQRVVLSLVAVAQNFGLTTVAEGVEKERTLRLLRAMEVDCVQGYLIGRPRGNWTTEAEVASVPASSHRG
jgi:PAS domain S-box-containing protein